MPGRGRSLGRREVVRFQGLKLLPEFHPVHPFFKVALALLELPTLEVPVHGALIVSDRRVKRV